jgi:hypothetical protein
MFWHGGTYVCTLMFRLFPSAVFSFQNIAAVERQRKAKCKQIRTEKALLSKHAERTFSGLWRKYLHDSPDIWEFSIKFALDARVDAFMQLVDCY